MASYGLQTNYDLAVSIGVSSTGTPPTWTYADLEDGIDNISEALNEVVQQYQFLSDKGFAKNHVTGVAPSFTFTGKRVYGDTAQDFIFGTKYQLDSGRKSSLKIVDNGSGTAVTLTVDCTICNIQEYGGAATDDQSISFELRFDGQPTIS
jgi:hypothetical protein